MVSSNSKNIPIVAHSNNSTFKISGNTTAGLKSWVEENIAFNDILETMPPVKEVSNQWHYLSEGRIPYPDDDDNKDKDNPNGGSSGRYSHTVNQQTGPLMQTIWGQNSPYNNAIPNANPTGCVATALAQIMRYYEYPATFNWTIMDDAAKTGDTPGNAELAALMLDIGDKVNMTYAPTGSSAYSEDALTALINNYGYSPEATYSKYDFYTVKQEVNTYKRPVYMDGCHTSNANRSNLKTTGYSDCHAWICDGYKQQYDVYIYNEGTAYEYSKHENRYEWLHMNWGWDSRGNGWFYKNFVAVAVNNTIVKITVDGKDVSPNFKYNRKCIYTIKH